MTIKEKYPYSVLVNAGDRYKNGMSRLTWSRVMLGPIDENWSFVFPYKDLHHIEYLFKNEDDAAFFALTWS